MGAPLGSGRLIGLLLVIMLLRPCGDDGVYDAPHRGGGGGGGDDRPHGDDGGGDDGVCDAPHRGGCVDARHYTDHNQQQRYSQHFHLVEAQTQTSLALKAMNFYDPQHQYCY